MELIDIALQKGMISEKEHKAGLYLRILRYKLFGKAMTTAKNYERTYGMDIHESDDIIEKSKLYNKSLNILKCMNVLDDVLNICIFNIAPKFRDLKNFRLALQELFKLYQVSFTV